MKKIEIVADDLIDFSDREDEFLSADIQQKAMAFAIITAVVGFIFSTLLFLNRKVGPASKVLDRREAEGRVVTQARGGGGDSRGAYGGFRPPRLTRSKSRNEKDEKQPWKGLKTVASLQDVAKKRKSKPRKTVAKTDLGSSPDYTRRKKVAKAAPVTIARPKKTTPDRPEDLDRLLFPLTEDRPERTGLRDISSKMASQVFFVEDRRGQYHPGVILDSSGRALVPASQLGNLDNIWISGRQRKATVLATDREFGLSLIRVGGTFSDVPLSPAPPAAGEKIVGFTPSGRRALGQIYRSGISFGKAGFFTEGDFGGSPGAPLFNDRGELVGLHIASLPGAPGPGIHLACDSSVIYRLMRGYRGGGSLSSTLSDSVERMRNHLRGIESKGEARRGRAVPGVGLTSFHLGMAQEEALESLSAPEVSEYNPDITLIKSPAPPVTLYFVGGRLALAGTEHSSFATPEGLAFGAEAIPRQLTRVYPDLESFYGLHSVPGLDILVDGKNRVTEFVVRPDMSR